MALAIVSPEEPVGMDAIELAELVEEVIYGDAAATAFAWSTKAPLYAVLAAFVTILSCLDVAAVTTFYPFWSCAIC